jgi:hypothetical protein
VNVRLPGAIAIAMQGMPQSERVLASERQGFAIAMQGFASK